MRIVTALFCALCILFSVTTASAERRVAFVVGNGAYKNVPALPNPTIDAKSMASALRNVGFEVVEGTNLTRDTMTAKLLEFGQKSQGADVAVFYYAGHGIAVNGANYLLPIDADLKSEMDVRLGAAINIDVTLDQTMGDAKVKLVFLDACRDNPFANKIKAAAKTSRSVNVADRPCRDEVRRRHADRLRHRSRARPHRTARPAPTARSPAPCSPTSPSRAPRSSRR